MPRIKVYLKKEDPKSQQASHSSSRTLWDFIVACGAGKQLKQGVGQLTTDESWRSLKDRLKPEGGKGKLIPRLKAPQAPINLDLAYPEAGRETVRHPHEALRVACVQARERLAQARLGRRPATEDAASAQAHTT